MNIDRTNFVETLPLVLDAIATADLVAIDAEFTGIWDARTETEHANFALDSFEERYAKVKRSAQAFAVVQYGVCTFQRKGDGSFVAKPFNFYVSPQDPTWMPGDRARDAHCFKFQPESMRFLSEYGFDFNRAFGKGVGYLSEDAAEKRDPRKRSKKATKESDQNRRQSIIPLSNLNEADRAIVDGIVDALKSFKPDKPKAFIVLDAINAYLRRIVYQEFTALQATVPTLAACTLEKRADDNGGKKTNIARMRVTYHGSPEGADKFTSAREAADLAASIASFESARGISAVVAKIIASRCPLAVHNGLLDMLHTFEMCVGALPPTLEDFCAGFRRRFPIVFDSKYIVEECRRAHPKVVGAAIVCSALKEAYEAASSKLPGKPIGIELASGFGAYGEGASLPHEAGFDAFMTGALLLRMGAWIKANPAASPFPLANRINLMRIDGCLDLEGGNVDEHIDEVRSRCVIVDDTNGATTGQLIGIFRPKFTSERINVHWKSKTCAWIVAPSQEIAEKALADAKVKAKFPHLRILPAPALSSKKRKRDAVDEEEEAEAENAKKRRVRETGCAIS